MKVCDATTCGTLSILTNSSTTKMTKDLKRRITLFLDPSIVKHARTQAILEDLTLTNLVEKALLAYLPSEIIIKKPNVLIDNN
jgi:hypothetical protein